MKEPVIHLEKKSVRKTVILIFWIIIWQLMAVMIDNSILFTGPLEVIKELVNRMWDIDFYQTIGMSLMRITGGFLLGFLGGILFGVIGFFISLIHELLSPVISLLKSIPIASFVVLLLIWTGSENLAVFVAFLVVFPNAYLHTRMGLKSTDIKLLEMADVFQLSFPKRLHFLYKPAMMPFLISCMEIAVGMSFKSGVAAEVIGTPKFSFGEKLYMSKIQLNTPGIFAWTIVIILASFVMEKGFLVLFRRYEKRPLIPNRIYTKKRKNKSKRIEKRKNLPDRNQNIQIENLSKLYHDKIVFRKVNLTLERGKTYCIMGPSGCGKTTFLHVLLGIEKPDSGKMKGVNRQDVSAVFQEPRLLEEYTALENAFLFGTLSNENGHDLEEFEKIIPGDAANKLAKELSGGMQKRVAILRAMASSASVIILDEPFTGLDEVTRKKTAEYILEKKGSRTILVSTHSLEDVWLLKGEIIDGNKSGFNWNNGGK